MELFKRIIEIVDANLIYSLIPIILSLFLIELIFKDRFETKKALNVIRWAIVTYTVITLVFYLVGTALNPDQYVFVNRVKGSFSWSNWIMLLSALVLPLTLFVEKMASKFWYVLLVAFLMKSGV